MAVRLGKSVGGLVLKLHFHNKHTFLVVKRKTCYYTVPRRKDYRTPRQQSTDSFQCQLLQDPLQMWSCHDQSHVLTRVVLIRYIW